MDRFGSCGEIVDSATTTAIDKAAAMTARNLQESSRVSLRAAASEDTLCNVGGRFGQSVRLSIVQKIKNSTRILQKTIPPTDVVLNRRWKNYGLREHVLYSFRIVFSACLWTEQGVEDFQASMKRGKGGVAKRMPRKDRDRCSL